MGDDREPVSAGDPRHPDHAPFLQELGRATYAASRVAGICFDIARVFRGVSSADMYNDPLGTLESRLAPLRKSQPGLPGLVDFLALLTPARETRNDLLHALPVRDGLHRRKTNDAHYVRNFFTVSDLSDAAEQLEATWQAGNRVLYADGGAAVTAWYRAGA